MEEFTLIRGGGLCRVGLFNLGSESERGLRVLRPLLTERIVTDDAGQQRGHMDNRD